MRRAACRPPSSTRASPSRSTARYFAGAGLLDRGLKIRTLVLPDRFIEHDAPAKQYEEAGLSATQIALAAQDALGITRPGIVALGG